MFHLSRSVVSRRSSKTLTMIFTINCLVTLIYSVVLSEALYGSNTDVVELTAGNFDGKVIQSDDIWLVEFYAPWCGHCQSLAPEWKKAATALKGIIKVGAVDMDVHNSVGGPYNVRGFPTIKIFGANKGSPIDYNGPRTAQGLTKAALEAAQSAVNQRLSGGGSGSRSSGSGGKTGGSGGSGGGNAKDVIELTDSNFEEKVLQSNELWLVEFFAPWCGHCQRLEPEWKKAATELKGKVNLGAIDATVHQSIGQRYGIQGFPTIKFFAPGSEPVDYQGGRSASDIVQFGLSKAAENVDPPEVVQLTENKILTDNCNEKPLCVVSILPDILDTGAAGRNTYLEILREIGDKYKSKLWGWVWSDAGSHPKLEEALGMGGFGYPTLAAVNVRKMKFSILKGSFDKAGIDEFLRRLAVGRGSTEPIRGAALPELKNAEPWDGKDGHLPVEDDIDLSDFDMDDDDSEKDEL